MMKWYASVAVAASVVLLSAQASHGNDSCRDVAKFFYRQAVEICQIGAKRINCKGYCEHLSQGEAPLVSVEFDDEEQRRECLQRYQIACQNERKYAYNRCTESAQERFHDRWLQCSFEGEVPNPPPEMPPVPDDQLFQ